MRISRRAKRILILGMILGALAGILITFLAANTKMRSKNEEMSAVKAQYEKEKKELQAKLTEQEEAQKKKETLSEEWYLVLVNNTHPLSQDYVPELASVDEAGHQVDARIVESLNKMLEDARKEGLDPQITSAYRSYDDQKEVFNTDMQTWLNQSYTYVDAYNKTKESIAVPGMSEHATGLALDITSPDYSELDDDQADTKEQKWLMENCQNYGFILRYPENKKDITNIVYEPWHYRYVGEEAAKEIMSEGITLEEYLGAQ